jgi:hypothetical protein
MQFLWVAAFWAISGVPKQPGLLWVRDKPMNNRWCPAGANRSRLKVRGTAPQQSVSMMLAVGVGRVRRGSCAVTRQLIRWRVTLALTRPTNLSTFICGAVLSTQDPSSRYPREGGVQRLRDYVWIPASAGMTHAGFRIVISVAWYLALGGVRRDHRQSGECRSPGSFENRIPVSAGMTTGVLATTDVLSQAWTGTGGLPAKTHCAGSGSPHGSST